MLSGDLPGSKEPEQAEPVDMGKIKERYLRGELEEAIVQIEVPETTPVVPGLFGQGGQDELGQGLQEFFNLMMPKRVVQRRVTVAEARELLTQQETEKLIDWEEVYREAVSRVEETAIYLSMRSIRLWDQGEAPRMFPRRVQRDISPTLKGLWFGPTGR